MVGQLHLLDAVGKLRALGEEQIRSGHEVRLEPRSVRGRLRGMADALTSLNQILGEVADLQRASELLEWDERVYMPPAAAAPAQNGRAAA